MSTELITITGFRQKDARLHEAQVQRFIELPENTQVQVEFKIVSEAKFGKTENVEIPESFIVGLLKIEATFLLAAVDGIKSVGCKVIVGYQGVFTFDEDINLSADIKVSPVTVHAVTNCLLPATVLCLRRFCHESNLPNVPLPMNIDDLTKKLESFKPA